MSEEKLTFTQAELDEAIGRELRKARAEQAAEVEKAAEEAAANVPDYKALYEEVKAEREKLQAQAGDIIAEHEAQAKREAIVRAFFSGDYERQYRHDADAVAQVLEWFDVDKFENVDEAKKAAFSLKMMAPGIMQEIRGSKKKRGGLFRNKKGAN